MTSSVLLLILLSTCWLCGTGLVGSSCPCDTPCPVLTSMSLCKVPMWRYSWLWSGNSFWHTVHLYEISFVCFFMCRLRLLLSRNDLAHTLHLYGFSPVWVRIWTLIPKTDTTLPHSPHCSLFSPTLLWPIHDVLWDTGGFRESSMGFTFTLRPNGFPTSILTSGKIQQYL